MRWAHKITLTAFAKPEEDVEGIKEGILALVPFDLEEAKIELQEQKAKGFNERTVMIFTVKLTKVSHTNDFLQFLLDNLKEEQKELLISQAESRLDTHHDYFIRVDKQRWMSKQEIWLTDTGDCFHIKLTLAVFPKKRQGALDLIERFLRQKNI